jgi:hypothetical protein
MTISYTKALNKIERILPDLFNDSNATELISYYKYNGQAYSATAGANIKSFTKASAISAIYLGEDAFLKENFEGNNETRFPRKVGSIFTKKSFLPNSVITEDVLSDKIEINNKEHSIFSYSELANYIIIEYEL